MTKTPAARSCGQAGVTLVELLISIMILGIVTTFLIGGWISLQDSYAQSVESDNARAEVRDAVARMSHEIRGAQSMTLGTSVSSPFTFASPTEIDFYSSYNNAGVRADGSGTGALRLTRIYLDTGGTTPQKTLYWQRDTNGSGSFDSADHKMVLASDVVNNSIANTKVSPQTSYSAIFSYAYTDSSGDLTTADTIASGNLTKIISVRIHLIVDANLEHTPAPASLETTVRPRNTPANLQEEQ